MRRVIIGYRGIEFVELRFGMELWPVTGKAERTDSERLVSLEGS
jgi:hypothetical protein